MTPDGVVPVLLGEAADELGEHLGDRVGRGRLGGLDPHAVGGEVALLEVDRRALDAGAAEVDAEAVGHGDHLSTGGPRRTTRAVRDVRRWGPRSATASSSREGCGCWWPSSPADATAERSAVVGVLLAVEDQGVVAEVEPRPGAQHLPQRSGAVDAGVAPRRGDDVLVAVGVVDDRVPRLEPGQHDVAAGVGADDGGLAQPVRRRAFVAERVVPGEDEAGTAGAVGGMGGAHRATRLQLHGGEEGSHRARREHAGGGQDRLDALGAGPGGGDDTSDAAQADAARAGEPAVPPRGAGRAQGDEVLTAALDAHADAHRGQPLGDVAEGGRVVRAGERAGLVHLHGQAAVRPVEPRRDRRLPRTLDLDVQIRLGDDGRGARGRGETRAGHRPASGVLRSLVVTVRVPLSFQVARGARGTGVTRDLDGHVLERVVDGRLLPGQEGPHAGAQVAPVDDVAAGGAGAGGVVHDDLLVQLVQQVVEVLPSHHEHNA